MKSIVHVFILMSAMMLLSQKPVAAQDKSSDKVSADVECVEIGALNGETSYRYDVTLINLTKSKLKVEYTVYLKAGDVIKKQHSHSTILIPEEETIESNENKMRTEDWDKVTIFRVEWTATEL